MLGGIVHVSLFCAHYLLPVAVSLLPVAVLSELGYILNIQAALGLSLLY